MIWWFLLQQKPQFYDHFRLLDLQVARGEEGTGRVCKISRKPMIIKRKRNGRGRGRLHSTISSTGHFTYVYSCFRRKWQLNWSVVTKGPVDLLPFGVVELSLEQLAESFHIATARLWFGLLVMVFILCVKHDKAENAEHFFTSNVTCGPGGRGWSRSCKQ